MRKTQPSKDDDRLMKHLIETAESVGFTVNEFIHLPDFDKSGKPEDGFYFVYLNKKYGDLSGDFILALAENSHLSDINMRHKMGLHLSIYFDNEDDSNDFLDDLNTDLEYHQDNGKDALGYSIVFMVDIKLKTIRKFENELKEAEQLLFNSNILQTYYFYKNNKHNVA